MNRPSAPSERASEDHTSRSSARPSLRHQKPPSAIRTRSTLFCFCYCDKPTIPPSLLEAPAKSLRRLGADARALAPALFAPRLAPARHTPRSPPRASRLEVREALVEVVLCLLSECSLSFAPSSAQERPCTPCTGCSSPGVRLELAARAGRGTRGRVEEGSGMTGGEFRGARGRLARVEVREGVPRRARVAARGSRRAPPPPSRRSWRHFPSRSGTRARRRDGDAPFAAFWAFAALSARALADFCALPPPMVRRERSFERGRRGEILASEGGEPRGTTGVIPISL